MATDRNSLFAFAERLLTTDFLRSPKYGGYLYAQVQWNKLVINRQNHAGTSPDPGFHIKRGTDAS